MIADLEIFNTGEELVSSVPPETADAVLQTLLRARFRKKVELEPVERWLVWGGADAPLAALETPAGLLELVDREPARCDPEELFEIARIEAGMARFGLEFGTDSMPAEAGLEERGRRAGAKAARPAPGSWAPPASRPPARARTSARPAPAS